MPPDDPTPLGDAMTHRFASQKIPEPRPAAGPAGRGESTSGAARREADIAQRPSLPDHPERMAADVEDEEADPVVDSGPGIADGMKIMKKHQG
jgi:hypothetical protein